VLTNVEIPAPIDNEQLMKTFEDMTLLNQPVPNANYVQLSPAMWQFLHNIYGGGPAIELPLTSV